VYQGGSFKNYEGKVDKSVMYDDAAKRIPSSVEEITEKKMETFLNEHKTIPKAFFFGKPSESLLVRSIKMQLSDRMAVAVIPKTEKELTGKYKVEKFPSIMIIPAENPKDENKPEPVFFSRRFIGPEIIPWLDARALPDNSDDEVFTLIEELTDDSCMKAICTNDGLCAILIVSLDPSDPKYLPMMKEYLPMMNQLDDYQSWMLYRTKNLPQPLDRNFRFVWMNGLKQKDFIGKAFGLQPQDYPQFVALDPKRVSYANFANTFSFENIKEFLIEVRSRQLKPKPMSVKELPHLVGETKRCEAMIPPEPKTDPSKKTKSIGKRGQRGGKGPVKLSEINFNRKLVASESNWMVAFVDDKDKQKDFLGEWKKASLTLKNMVRFGTVDCSKGKNKDLASAYGVKSFPAIKTFVAGFTKNEENADTYEGGLTMDDLVKHAVGMIQSSDDYVHEITKRNMMGWFRENLDTPRLLYLSEQSVVPDLLKAAAVEYNPEEMIMGFSDDAQLAKALRVRSFPAVIMLSAQMGPNSELAFRLRGRKKDVKIGRNRIPSKILKNINRLLKWTDNIVEQWQKFKKQHSATGDSMMKDPAWTAYSAPYAPEMDTFKGKMPQMPKKEKHDEL